MAAVPSTINPWALKRASLVYPMPVAMACGRVLRARTPQEKIDASLRAGEILARYLAAVALSSFSARDGGEELALPPLEGNLAFGHFLSLIQQVSKLNTAHPARPYIDAGFKPKKGTALGVTDAALQALLELRNELGHQLDTLHHARAQSILGRKDPEAALAAALAGVEGLLCLPLFVIEDQQLIKKTICVRRLLLMGESADPTPDEIELEVGVDELRIPYLAAGKTLLRLPPALVWDIIEERANYQILFVDQLNGNNLVYKTVAADQKVGSTQSANELNQLCSGLKRPAEEVRLRDGRHLAQEWSEHRKLIEEAGQRGEGLIPWHLLDPASLQWFAHRLNPNADPSNPAATVCSVLLDGRTSVDGHERRQLVLLFGKSDDVRAELRRDILDLQLNRNPSERWEDRRLVEKANLLEALREAVIFVSKHLQVNGLTLDGLSNPAGPADYKAIREALINQFIHQDYTDQSAPAQVVIRADKTVLFNVGYSLVDTDRLVEGGKSQSRNPLIARALRLIGFAELAGSGIRVMEQVWIRARRRPPRFENDRKANNFTLTLDWRPLPELHDEFWHGRLGVKLSERQAKLLEQIRDPAGKALTELCASVGCEPEDVQTDLEHLEKQVLIQRDGDRYVLMSHLREILG